MVDYFGCDNVVNALVKLEILKAIHNNQQKPTTNKGVVNALVKLEILKAIHNFVPLRNGNFRLSMH